MTGAATRGADLFAVEGVMTTENQRNRTDVDKALLGHATYRSLGEQQLSPAEERFEKPQNAVVYGSGAVPITTMIRSGISFDVIGAILIMVFLPLMVAVTGLGAG